uniref:Uncharacterized protein n=1 Tax=Cyclophora tenuis TaxID=216820 RepID=A0A7S1D3H3_CYCTE|mmetsp:Transcript_2103/g.3712  ORF Transcript_2103/g.3712 Transcript_2103/m.3712 type:complete len:218 (+) Transcript_2103:62-715(+)|eukprot:CAMPEP_0116564180 /NCGR_PEP_ID=MMETSP0397-20121206/13162_1 /TAXON_ID=216820 /ORGANISM="Cyclophora tenuis, Strain ECT3854" /LENGTH=217 /DNA_ID=CAMNT_0004090739 /DNA_START=44 /DNA_END=697 /DNA_ORIENTATION=-
MVGANNEVEVPSSVLVDESSPHEVEIESVVASYPSPAGFVVQKLESVTSEESSMTSGSMFTSSQDSSSEDEEDEDASANAAELLAYANIRLQQQRLQNEVKQLREILSQKDEQVTQLTGQLRRAITSKCDLVVACTEMERLKEEAEKYGSEEAREVKKGYLSILEGRADMEREFMNELAALSEQMCNMDRRYKNQLLEKDFEIAQLEEKLRRLDRKS